MCISETNFPNRKNVCVYEFHCEYYGALVVNIKGKRCLLKSLVVNSYSQNRSSIKLVFERC